MEKNLTSRNYGNVGGDLCTSLATMLLKIMSRQNIDRDTRNIEAFLLCRLIPLDKNPGVRPIGVGEVLRRSFGKALMHVIKGDITKSAGSRQVCAAGSDAAVNAMNKLRRMLFFWAMPQSLSTVSIVMSSCITFYARPCRHI